MDYSQSGEQAHILSWAERHGPGWWLDIGAFDGSTASNTRALAERGWGGVAVEPAAWPFDRLVDLYADRDDVDIVQAAIYTGAMQPPLLRFHYAHDMVSTTRDENADTWRPFVDFSQVWVCALELQEMLAAFPRHYDLVSVDTEGTSIEIFDALREHDAFAPGALAVVEAEDGGERFQIQQACLEGWARTAVTANNVLLERLS